MNIARTKVVVAVLAVFLVFIQFVQPRRTNPSSIASRGISAHVQIPEKTIATLRKGCGDCHSNQTVWPWYSHVAPFSWIVVDDVKQGRRHLNFDDWEAQENPKEANEHLVDICKEIQQKGMPPFSYSILHPQSGLSAEEITSVCSWSKSFQTSAGDGADVHP